MFSVLLLTLSLIQFTNNVCGDEVIPIGTKGDYDYKKALHASLLFYEAQRSGKLPDNNRIKWRGDSMLDDGKDVGHDLTGGYFDAGDQVKFGFPMAFTITTLAWGLIDYQDSYIKAGELENMRNAIKWGTDYFIKCHTSEDEFYGQVGNGAEDHASWSRPEDWPKSKVRPAYKVTSAHGGSELTGETAAALAATSIAFKEVDPTYSETLLKHSKSLYSFADKYRDTYTTEISDAIKYYKSFSGYGDELSWAAAWLLRATNDTHYKSEVEKHFAEFKGLQYGGSYGWDNKGAGVQTLMAEITGEDKYKTLVKKYCDYGINHSTKTPKGLLFMGEWGSLRNVANFAFICLQAHNIGINSDLYLKIAQSQIDYILGDGGRSYVIGVGHNPPVQPHHRASSCPDKNVSDVCDWKVAKKFSENPQTLYGALVGGPNKYDEYNDTRTDYVHNEVACDYNAGFQSALAAIIHFKE